MAKKPTCKELEQRVKQLEKESLERKRADDALRESEEKYRNLADSIADVFFAFDEDLKYTYWNEASERLTGTSASDAIGKQILEIFPDNEETRRALEAYQEVLRTQQPRSFVNEYHLGGKQYFFEISAYPSPHGVSVFVKDITEQKKVEEALRESKELFEKIFISQLNAIFILNSEAPPKIIDCNPATTKIFGYSREEMLGRTTALLHVSEATLKKFQENLYLAIEGCGYCHLPEFEMKRKNGTMFPTEHSVVPLRGEQGRLIGWVSVVRDIAECKRTIDALEEGEKKYRDLVENIRDVIYSIDKNGVMTYINPAIESVLGYSPSEIIGKPFVEFIYKEDLPRVKDHFKEVVCGRIEANEYRVLSKSGGVRWILTSSKPVFAGNDVIGVQGVLTDITERKRAEEALKEREAELEIKTNSLEEVNTALKVLLKRRSEDKRELEGKVLSNMKELALPYLEKLKKSGFDERQRVYLDVLELNLNDIISPFLRRLSSRYLGFTPAEIQVANLIRHGKTTKEIAEFLNLSSDTIDFHRKNIRNKIGIKNKKTNLRTHLLSME